MQQSIAKFLIRNSSWLLNDRLRLEIVACYLVSGSIYSWLNSTIDNTFNLSIAEIMCKRIKLAKSFMFSISIFLNNKTPVNWLKLGWSESKLKSDPDTDCHTNFNCNAVGHHLVNLELQRTIDNNWQSQNVSIGHWSEQTYVPQVWPNGPKNPEELFVAINSRELHLISNNSYRFYVSVIPIKSNFELFRHLRLISWNAAEHFNHNLKPNGCFRVKTILWLHDSYILSIVCFHFGFKQESRWTRSTVSLEYSSSPFWAYDTNGFANKHFIFVLIQHRKQWNKHFHIM